MTVYIGWRKFMNQASPQDTWNILRRFRRASNSNMEAVPMQVKKMIAPAWKFAKELLLFCSVGGLCGAAIGFFMYLHLGPFKSPEDAGYAAGLFVKAGVQVGSIVWMIHLVVLRLRRWFFGASKRIS
jgi:hypothetical protein